MTSIVARVAAVAKVDADLARLQEGVRRWTDRSGKSTQQHADAVAAWEGRVRAANAAGEDINEPRPEPSISADARVLWLSDTRAEQATLQGARLRAIVESREQIEAAARKRADKGMKTAQALLERFASAVDDVRAAQVALEELEGAKRTLDTRQPRPSHPPRLFGLLDLVQAVNEGRDPLDPFRPSQRRALGLQPGSTLGEQTGPEPEPAASAPITGQTVTVRGLDGRPL